MSFAPKIGNYRFSKNLGVGTFGKVKLAYNELTGHKVAIKILNKKKIKQQGVFEKVKREIKVLRRFNHPHIIKHFEFIDTTSDIFIVLEYAAGGELFDLISRKQRLDEDEARRIFQQVISAIEYSHLHRMAHRDLKPENLLLDEDNNIKLIDFGLANSMRDGASLITACGSPNYAAPEVISGTAYGGQEVDIWSCGVILFAMVYGLLPFQDEQLAVLFQKIKEGRYFLPNFGSRDLRDLINRMLQPNPVKRIKLKEIQSHPWYLQNLPKYLKSFSCTPMKYEMHVDTDIVRKLFEVDKKLNKTFEEVCKDVAEKKAADYVGSYELMKHDKLKRECFEQNLANNNPNPSASTSQSSTMQQQIQRSVPQSNSNNPQGMPIFTNATPAVSEWCMVSSESHHQQPTHRKHLSDTQQKRLNWMKYRMEAQPETANSHISTKINNLFWDPNHIEDHSESQSNSENGSQKSGKTTTAANKYLFGLSFQGNVDIAMNLICYTLRQLDYEWNFTRDKKIKCRIRLDKQPLMDDEQYIQEFLLKQYLRFNVQIFKEPLPKTSSQVPVNSPQPGQEPAQTICIQLVKGSPMVFLDFCQTFVDRMRRRIDPNLGYNPVNEDAESESEQDKKLLNDFKQLKLV